MKEFKFTEHIKPYIEVDGQPYFRLQGCERQNVGTQSDLYMSTNSEELKGFCAGAYKLQNGEWMATGTFRNSLYLETLAKKTFVRDLQLLVDVEGAVRIKVMCATFGKGVQKILEKKIVSAERKLTVLNLPGPAELPENSRLFWHIDCLSPKAAVHEVTYLTRTQPLQDCRMAVLLRTFGRTEDIKSILYRFADSTSDSYFKAIFDAVSFVVLETTPGSKDAYKFSWKDKLNVDVIFSANLGGGGNAGHLLKMFEERCSTSKTPPTEILMLDDDLIISAETLARYFTFCSYRNEEFICSLPVLMKSDPQVVWEDGGFWGRLNFHEGGEYSTKRNLFPTLLKHGTRLDTFENLDQFSSLNTCEYSTFIFFGLSMKMFQKLGYPAAFFLRGDDVEYSLRAQSMGVQMITNPNLAAWHEPAHSYVQEYMAILHGIIINLTYSEHGESFYRDFFERRFYEHASINDLEGIRLYLDILDEIINEESPVLSTSFQKHYLEKFKRYSKIKMVSVPGANQLGYEHAARDQKVNLVPFVYPGYHHVKANGLQTAIFNSSAKAYRMLPPIASEEKLDLAQNYFVSLKNLVVAFDDIRNKWQNRLAESSQIGFWDHIRETYRSQTEVVERITKKAFTGLVREVPELALQKGGKSKAEKKNSAGLVRKMFMSVEQEDKTGVSEGASALPYNFDPAVYLMLNPDVKEAQVDPVEHFLEHGKKEKRAFSFD